MKQLKQFFLKIKRRYDWGFVSGLFLFNVIVLCFLVWVLSFFLPAKAESYVWFNDVYMTEKAALKLMTDAAPSLFEDD